MPRWAPMRGGRRARALWLSLAGCSAAGLIVLGLFLWRTHGALEESAREVGNESRVPFQTLRLTPAAIGFEPVRSQGSFSGAAFAEGSVFLAGDAGVFEFSPAGDLLREWRSGRDLPAAKPSALAAGPALNSAGKSLYVATTGEGLLILDASNLDAPPRQVRAEEVRFRDVTAVLPLASGRVLLGTRHAGLLSFDGASLTRLHPSLNDVSVTALAGDEGDLWIGTLSEGVLHWRAGRLDRFSEPEGLPDPQVLSLAAHEDAAYAGTPLGVAEFRQGRFERQLAYGVFAASLQAQGTELKIGTLDEGVFTVPLEASAGRRRVARVESPRNQPVKQLLNNGETLYALLPDGLYSAPGSMQQALAAPGALLHDNNISALAFDGGGRLWVGYFDRGLDVLEAPLEKTSAPARHIEDEYVFCVNRIVHDPRRNLTAVAAANGLAFFDAAAERRQVLRREDGLISSHVTDVLLTPEGMTVATPAGVTFIDSGGVRSLYAFHGLVNNHVYTLARAGGRLLAGTLGGLSVIESGAVQASYTTANSSLGHNWISAIAPFEGGWFVGAYGAGVHRLDSAGTWHRFADLPEGLEVNPNAMLAADERVYAGMLGAGLYVYSAASGRWSAVTEGLPSLNVTALARREGHLYVGTDNGLVRIAEDRLNLP